VLLLGKDEAKRCMQAGFSNVRSHVSNSLVTLQDAWVGDHLDFQANLLGKSTNGRRRGRGAWGLEFRLVKLSRNIVTRFASRQTPMPPRHDRHYELLIAVQRATNASTPSLTSSAKPVRLHGQP
jgi:hypothetical protein